MHRRLITFPLLAWGGGFIVVLCLANLVSPWFVPLLVPFVYVGFRGLSAMAPYLNQTGRRHLPWLTRIPGFGSKPEPELLANEPRNLLTFAPNAWYVRPLSLVAEADMLALEELHQFVYWELAHVNKWSIERSLEQVRESLLAFCVLLLERSDRWTWVRYEDARRPVSGDHVASLAINDALDAFTQLILVMQFFVEQSEQRVRNWAHVSKESATAYQAHIADLKNLLPLSLLRALRHYVAHVDRPPIWILGFLRRDDSRLGRPLAEIELRLDAHRLLALESLRVRRAGNASVLELIGGVKPDGSADFWPLLCDMMACVQSLCEAYDVLHSTFLLRGQDLIDGLLRRHPEVAHSQVVFMRVSHVPHELSRLRPAGEVNETIDLEMLRRDLGRLAAVCRIVETLSEGNVPLVDPNDL